MGEVRGIAALVKAPKPSLLCCFLRVWENLVTDSRGREAMISLARSVSNRLGGFGRHLARRSRLTCGNCSARVSTAIEWPAPRGLAQLKLGPASNIVSPIAHGLSKAETNCYLTQVNVDAKTHFHIGEDPAEAWIPRRFADQWPLNSFPRFFAWDTRACRGSYPCRAGSKPDPRSNLLARRHRFALVKTLDASAQRKLRAGGPVGRSVAGPLVA